MRFVVEVVKENNTAKVIVGVLIVLACCYTCGKKESQEDYIKRNTPIIGRE